MTGSEVRTTWSGNVWGAERVPNASHTQAGFQLTVDLGNPLFDLVHFGLLN